MRRCAAAAALCVALPAEAAPGDHIRVGEAEIIPSVDLGIEHRTNVFQRETRAIAGTAIRLAPKLSAAFEGANVAARFGGSWELRKYIQAQATSLDRLNDFQVTAGLDLFRASPIGLELTESAFLVNNVNDSGGAIDPFTTQLNNRAGAILHLRLGPAFEVKPSFNHQYTDFRVPQGALFGVEGRQYNTRQILEPGLQAEWQFFPRTSLVFDGAYKSHVWDENVRPRFDQEGGALEVALPNSRHIKATLGVQGQVTERITSTLELGYGVGNYVESDVDASTVLFNADVRYAVTPTQRFALGFRRDFDDVWFSNYIAYSNLYARYEGKYGPRLKAVAEALFRTEAYEGEAIRDDTFLRLKLDGSVAIQRWATTTLGVWYSRRGSTDAVVQFDDVNVHWLATFTY